MKKLISVFGSKVGKEEIEGVTACLESQWLGFGKKVDEFEEQFAKRLGLPYFAMVDSGSNALFLAIHLLDLPPGSEIILPSFTWVSCAQAILMAGHVPVFCDIDLATFNVTLDTISPHLTPKTGAIMVVHYAGKPVDINPIKSLGLPIIEDAAHAVDSTYHGKACGGLTEVGIYSFDAVKNLTAGEGGGISVNSEQMLKRTKTLRYCGIGKSGFEAAINSSEGRWWEYNIQEPFIKMLPNNITASIGLAQLGKLEQLQAYRKQLWDTYQQELASLSWIIRPADPEAHERHSYFTYVIRVSQRDDLAHYLFEKGIYTTLRYHPLHLVPLYKSNAKLPNTEQLNLDALSIPLHPNLTAEEQAYIIETIKAFNPDLPFGCFR